LNEDSDVGCDAQSSTAIRRRNGDTKWMRTVGRVLP